MRAIVQLGSHFCHSHFSAFLTRSASRSAVKIQARGRGMIVRKTERRQLAATSTVTKEEVNCSVWAA